MHEVRTGRWRQCTSRGVDLKRRYSSRYLIAHKKKPSLRIERGRIRSARSRRKRASRDVAQSARGMVDLVGCHESLIAAIDVRSVRHIQECLVGDHDVWSGKRTGAD